MAVRLKALQRNRFPENSCRFESRLMRANADVAQILGSVPEIGCQFSPQASTLKPGDEERYREETQEFGTVEADPGEFRADWDLNVDRGERYVLHRLKLRKETSDGPEIAGTQMRSL